MGEEQEDSGGRLLCVRRQISGAGCGKVHAGVGTAVCESTRMW